MGRRAGTSITGLPWEPGPNTQLLGGAGGGAWVPERHRGLELRGEPATAGRPGGTPFRGRPAWAVGEAAFQTQSSGLETGRPGPPGSLRFNETAALTQPGGRTRSPPRGQFLRGQPPPRPACGCRRSSDRPRVPAHTRQNPPALEPPRLPEGSQGREPRDDGTLLAEGATRPPHVAAAASGLVELSGGSPGGGLLAGLPALWGLGPDSPRRPVPTPQTRRADAPLPPSPARALADA